MEAKDHANEPSGPVTEEEGDQKTALSKFKELENDSLVCVIFTTMQ